MWEAMIIAYQIGTCLLGKKTLALVYMGEDIALHVGVMRVWDLYHVPLATRECEGGHYGGRGSEM